MCRYIIIRRVKGLSKSEKQRGRSRGGGERGKLLKVMMFH